MTKKIIKTVLIILAVFVVIFLLTNKKSVGHFSNADSQRVYNENYDKLIKAMPKAEALDIQTSWGLVHGYVWKNESAENKPPVVLIPGRSSGVPMWRENLEELIKEHTVYAFDALGDAGRSCQTVPFSDYDDTYIYLSEVLKTLKLGKVHILGHSIGGRYAAGFALKYPEQVYSLALLDPVFTVNFPPFSTLFWATVGSMEFLPKSWQNHALSKMTGDKSQEFESNDPMAEMITTATSGYSAYLPSPDALTENDLKELNMPVYIAVGGKSPLTGEKAATNAKLISNVKLHTFEEATHSLPMQYPKEVGNDLNEFWAENDTKVK